MALYETGEDSPFGPGIPVTTQSMIKTFRMCPREAFYKYDLRLKPKVRSIPLTRGKWVHAVLETFYKAKMAGKKGDKAWRKEHALWVSRYRKLFDEEKEALGDLPTQIEQLMESYFWYYQDDDEWEVIEIEKTVEALLPNGHLFRGRVDGLVRTSSGLFIVDHKSHKRLPDWQFRMLDEQSPLYIWAAREMGIPVDGFIWNYLCTADFPSYRVVEQGKRFSRRLGQLPQGADYLSLKKAVAAAYETYGRDVFASEPAEKTKLRLEMLSLRELKWAENEPQRSERFRRDVIEKSDDMIARVVATAVRTSDAMHSYDFTNEDTIERNVNACKGFMCGYASLSMADLVVGDSERLRRSDYRESDPLEYYGEEEKF